MTKIPAAVLAVVIASGLAAAVTGGAAHAACDREVSLLGPGARAEGTAPQPYTVTTDVAFTVTSKYCATAGTVEYTTLSASAQAGSDFLTHAGTLAFADGDSSDRTVTVRVLPDAVLEEHEVVRVCLLNPKGRLRIGLSVAAGAILNDDGLTPPTQNPLPEIVCSR